ncbi:MAG: hypothetical protein ACI4WY_09185 [Anaerovoracaceae bacterium]
MNFAPPVDYDKVMKQVPFGKVITVGKIREYFAKVSGAEAQKEMLEAEGHTIIQKGRKKIRYYVKDYENVLFDPEQINREL